MPYRKVKYPDRFCKNCNAKLCDHARYEFKIIYCKNCRYLHEGFKNKKNHIYKGFIPWNKGMKMPYIPHLNNRGEKNSGWKGGVSFNRKYDSKRRRWSNDVRQRDGMCLFCGAKDNLQADHIKSWALYPELRYDLENGRTLCFNCHKKTKTYGKMTHIQINIYGEK